MNAGGVPPLVDYVNESKENDRLPGIMTLGYIAAFSETLALAIILHNGVKALATALNTESHDHIKVGSGA